MPAFGFPLGPELFIAKHGAVAKVREDPGQRRSVLKRGLGFDAGFVSRIAASTVGDAFMRQCPLAAIVADAKQFGALPQGALRRVVERVLLQGARRDQAKTGAKYPRAE